MIKSSCQAVNSTVCVDITLQCVPLIQLSAVFSSEAFLTKLGVIFNCIAKNIGVKITYYNIVLML